MGLMKNILWLSTGGTIACKLGENGLSPDNSQLQMKKMLAEIPQINKFCKVECREIMNIDSTEILPRDWRKLADLIDRYIKKSDSIDGIVITHGTDTMAYTGAMLSNMLINVPVPVIITGSQLPFFEENSDGKINLSDSFLAACNEKLKAVCLVFAGKIMLGKDAYKINSVDKSAFVSIEKDIGKISNETVYIYNEQLPQGTYKYAPDFSEEVMLIKITPNISSKILDFVKAIGVQGIVIEGYGLGGIPTAFLSALELLCKSGVRCVLVSQCVFGGTNLGVYSVGTRASLAGIEDWGNVTSEFALTRLMWELKNK